MIRMLIADFCKEEAALLHREAKEQAALLTGDEWQIRIAESWEKADEMAGKLLNIAYMDATANGGIAAAERIRKNHRNVYMVLIVSEEISPLCYLKPSVMTASILQRPLTPKAVRENLRETMLWFAMSENNMEDVFVIAKSDGKLRIPYQKILYFEAREKKIYAALESEEYGFYDSMEHLQNSLPGFFVRCHRGFIVNMRYLKKIKSASNCCMLEGKIEIPVSRSYRHSIKEYFE